MAFSGKTLPILLCVGLMSVCSTAQAQDFGEWRALTAEEEQARIVDVPADSIDPATVEGYFDGDGTRDMALIAVHKRSGVRGVIATMKGRVRVISPDGVEEQDGLGLTETGPRQTICGNAFRRFHEEACRSGYPAEVRLKNPGILWIGRGITVLYFWNSKKGGFEGVTMVD